MSGARAEEQGLHRFVFLVFAAATLTLAWPWLSGAVTIPWDAKAHSYAQLVFLAHALHTGESPFWTPNVFAGSVQIADPQSLIFTPPFLLLAALDTEPSFQAADAIVFAMLLAGGSAMIFFFKDRHWHPAGALVAALAFAFGGSAAWRIQHIGEVLSLCWFPITLFLLARTLERRSVPYGLAAGLTGAIMVIGRDQIAFLCALVFVLYVAWQLLAERGRLARIRALLVPLAAGLATCVVVSAVPLAFTIALAAQSNRPEIDFASAARGSLHPAAFLTALAADLYGTRGPMADYWGPPSSLIWGPNDFVLARNMGDVYFGALPLVALVCGLARGRLLARGNAVFVVAALGLFLYAFGSYTPLFRLFFALPGVDLFRRPADATFPLGAVLALVSGYCLHAELTCPKPWSRRAITLALLIFAALFASAIGVAIAVDHLRQALPPLGTALVFLVIAAAIVRLGSSWATRRPVAVIVMIGCAMVIDLIISNGPNESTALPPRTYDVLRPDTANATIALVKRTLAENAAPDRRDRVEFAAVGYEWPNAALVHGFDNDLGFNPVRLELYTAATGAGDQVAVPQQRVFSPLYPSYRSTMADLLGLRLIVTGVPAEEMDHRLAPGDINLIARTPDAFVYENPHALPRVLFATEAREANFDALLTSGAWPFVDYRQTVLLQHLPKDQSLGHAPGTARILAYHDTDITIEAQSPQGGYVVLNDVWQRWWRVDVDGTAAKMLRANVAFRAVAVPPGRHIVRFTFHPLRGLIEDIGNAWHGDRQSSDDDHAQARAASLSPAGQK